MKSTVIITLLLFIVGCYSACDKDWAAFGGKCYKKFAEKLFWKKAKKSCEENNADLVKIESAEESDFLKKKFLHIPIGKAFSVAWIGLIDKNKNGEFRWIDGTKPKYTNWSPYQPKHQNGGQDCGLIGRGWFWPGGPTFKPCWLFFHCHLYMKYICEKPQDSSSSE